MSTIKKEGKQNKKIKAKVEIRLPLIEGNVIFINVIAFDLPRRREAFLSFSGRVRKAPVRIENATGKFK